MTADASNTSMGVKRWLWWFEWSALCVAGLCSVGAMLMVTRLGCVAPMARKVTPQVEASAEVTAALARVGELEAALAKVEAGDIAVGGKGDSVTAWILALGAVINMPLGGLFYQFVLRPMALPRRRRRETS